MVPPDADSHEAAIARAHDVAVERGEPMYADPDTGLMVMTAPTLAERGACCGSGCRHCPYSQDARRAAGRPGS